MTDQHPLEKARITRDRDETGDYLIIHDASPNHPAKPDGSLVERVAQWGYDQRGEVHEAELQQARDHVLEATLAEVSFLTSRAALLLRRLDPARRPKPPSLKKQALKAAHIELDTESKNGSLIIRALEALPDD